MKLYAGYVRIPLENIQIEIDEIENNIEIHSKATAKIHLTDLKRLWRPLAIGLTLLTMHNFCGHVVVVMNTQDIFHKAGFTGSGENVGGVPAVIIAAGKGISTIIVLPLLDKFGRRPFCIISAVIKTELNCTGNILLHSRYSGLQVGLAIPGVTYYRSL